MASLVLNWEKKIEFVFSHPCTNPLYHQLFVIPYIVYYYLFGVFLLRLIYNGGQKYYYNGTFKGYF